MTLPFQKLPFLVMQNVLQIMGFLDLFLLSCTSSKTKRIVRNAFDVRKHFLAVHFQDALKILIQSGTNLNYAEAIYLSSKNEQKNRKVFHVNIGAVDRVPSDYTKQLGNKNALVLTTYWDDPKIRFNVFYNAVFEVFQAKFDGVMLDLDDVQVENYQELFNWIEDHLPPLPAFRIKGRCSFQNYIWLMKTVKARDHIQFVMEPTEYPENHETVNLEAEKVDIQYGKWMKIEDIQAINARDIDLRDISLTDDDINAFSKILDGFKEKSNLKKLSLEFFRVADTVVVLEGLNVIDEDEIKPPYSLKQWSFVMANGEKCTVIYAEYDNDLSDNLSFGFDILIGY
ncbi:unnamed protein product [Caenorhabditis brenneri]